jgi:hypothetical protein
MRFSWDVKKNLELQSEGRPSFEEVVEAIADSGVLADGPNPVHKGQRIFVVSVRDYPHVVPYEKRGEVLWLITVFPSRRYKNAKETN